MAGTFAENRRWLIHYGAYLQDTMVYVVVISCSCPQINDIRSAVNLVVCADEDRMVEWGEYTVKKIQTSTRERLKQ